MLTALAPLVLSSLPYWSGTIPDKSKPAAGYKELPGVSHFIVYGGDESTFGSYNHGPIITWHPDTNFSAHWYNGYHGESVNNRCLVATSDDGLHWSGPAVSFNTSGPIGLESEAFVNVGGRLYLSSSSWDINKRTGGGAEHSGPDVLLLRRQRGKVDLGEVFWLADKVPAGYESFGYKTYLQMDGTTKADMQRYLASLVNASPEEMNGFDNGEPNERSFYNLPSSNNDIERFCMLGRCGGGGGGSKGNGSNSYLLASFCNLTTATAAPRKSLSNDLPHRECRPGTGVFSYILSDADADALSHPADTLHSATRAVAAKAEPRPQPAQHTRPCNWTDPRFTTIPDSHTRTCISTLPNGDYYMLGSQIFSGRNPLTLAISKDGMDWSEVWSLRSGPSTPAGKKNNAYAYPGGVWRGTTFIAIYSIDKVQIAVSTFDLKELGFDGGF